MSVEEFELPTTRKARRFEHGLNANSVYKGHDQFGRPLGVDGLAEIPVDLRLLDHGLEEFAPTHIALMLFGRDLGALGNLTPECQPDSPFLLPPLVEGKTFRGDGAQRRPALFAAMGVQHSQSGFARRMTQSVNHHLPLVPEVVDEWAGGTIRFVGDGA